MLWKAVMLRMWRQEVDHLGRFKGRGPSAWAAVDVVRRSGTNSEQSSALLIGTK